MRLTEPHANPRRGDVQDLGLDPILATTGRHVDHATRLELVWWQSSRAWPFEHTDAAPKVPLCLPKRHEPIDREAPRFQLVDRLLTLFLQLQLMVRAL